MTNSDKGASTFQGLPFPGLHRLDNNMAQALVVVLTACTAALELGHRAVPEHVDPLMVEHPLSERSAGAEAVAAVDHCNRGAGPSKDKGVFHSRVATTHDHNGAVPEEEPVAGGAGADAGAAEVMLPGLAEPATVRASCDDDGVRENGARVRHDAERSRLEVHAVHELLLEACPEVRRLFLHEVDHLWPCLVQQPGEVLHVHPLAHELATKRRSDHHRAEPCPSGVDGRRQPSGAPTDHCHTLRKVSRKVEWQALFLLVLLFFVLLVLFFVVAMCFSAGSNFGF
mmetsp:Transcript_5207/g.15296  ORF Transcript_5207/g.15296 Transcript_5207/m.15296 type:complete len:284 (+) Transcript_5207:508-1359(+)